VVGVQKALRVAPDDVRLGIAEHGAEGGIHLDHAAHLRTAERDHRAADRRIDEGSTAALAGLGEG
jgi:hypothetical protein